MNEDEKREYLKRGKELGLNSSDLEDYSNGVVNHLPRTTNNDRQLGMTRFRARMEVEELLKSMFPATMEEQHLLYKTGDKDAPEVIKDNNGEVVLSLCRICGKGEADLREECLKR